MSAQPVPYISVTARVTYLIPTGVFWTEDDGWAAVCRRFNGPGQSRAIPSSVEAARQFNAFEPIDQSDLIHNLPASVSDCTFRDAEPADFSAVTAAMEAMG